MNHSARTCLVVIFGGVFSVAAPLWADTGQARFYTSLESHSYSDIAPIDQVIHGLEGPPVDDGEFAFTHNQLEIGETWLQFGLSYFWRYDYFLEFNGDTARLAYSEQNNVPLPTTGRYNIFLRANELRSQGVGFSYQWQLAPNLHSRLRLNYLRADDMSDGELAGVLIAEELGFSGDLQLDYGYSEDQLLGRQVEDVDGSGYSVDLDIRWRWGDQLEFALEGRDIWSRLRWKDLTYTRASATTDVISYDADGALASIPGIAGTEGYRSQSQQLPARYNLSARYQFNSKLSISPSVYAYDQHLFPRLALGWQLGNCLLQTSYELETGALGLNISHDNFTIGLHSDDSDWQQARALGLQLGIGFRF